MKYCLSARQTKEYRQKADELIIDWKDNEVILDFLQEYPNTTFTLNCFPREQVDWTVVQSYNKLLGNRFQICLESEEDIYLTKKIGVNFFLMFFVRDFYTFYRYKALGVNAIRITAPLTHQLNDILQIKSSVKIRVFPNIIGLKPFNGCSGLTGGWFRPEDFYKLDNIIDVAEFSPDIPIRREQALYRIYAEQHEWAGEVDMIIDDFDIPKILNRMIPPEFQERRSNCRQKCLYSNSCHYCEIIKLLTNPDFMRPIKEKIKEDIND